MTFFAVLLLRPRLEHPDGAKTCQLGAADGQQPLWRLGKMTIWFLTRSFLYMFDLLDVEASGKSQSSVTLFDFIDRLAISH